MDDGDILRSGSDANGDQSGRADYYSLQAFFFMYKKAYGISVFGFLSIVPMLVVFVRC